MAADLGSNSTAALLIQIYPVPGVMHQGALSQLPMTLSPTPTPLPMNYYPYSYALGMLPELPQAATPPPAMAQTIMSPTLMQVPVHVPLPMQMPIPQINQQQMVYPVTESELSKAKKTNGSISGKQQQQVRKHSNELVDGDEYLYEDGAISCRRSSGGIMIVTSRSTTSFSSEVSCEKVCTCYTKSQHADDEKDVSVPRDALELSKWQRMQTMACETKNSVGKWETAPVQSDLPKFADILANTLSPIDSFEHDKPSAFKDIYMNVALPGKVNKRRKMKEQPKKVVEDVTTMLRNSIKCNIKSHLATNSFLERSMQKSKTANAKNKSCSPIRIKLLSKPRILKTDVKQIKPVRFSKTYSTKAWQESNMLGLTAIKSELKSSLISNGGTNLPQQRSVDVRSMKMIYKRNECAKVKPTKEHSEMKVCGVKLCCKRSQLSYKANKSDSQRSRSKSGTCYPDSVAGDSLVNLLRSYPFDAQSCAYKDLQKLLQRTKMTTGKQELNTCISDKIPNTPHKFSEIFRNYTVEMMPSILYMSSSTRKFKPKRQKITSLPTDVAKNSTTSGQQVFDQHSSSKDEASLSTKFSHETYLNTCHYSINKCSKPPSNREASCNSFEDILNPFYFVKASGQSNSFDSKESQQSFETFANIIESSYYSDEVYCPQACQELKCVASCCRESKDGAALTDNPTRIQLYKIKNNEKSNPSKANKTSSYLTTDAPANNALTFSKQKNSNSFQSSSVKTKICSKGRNSCSDTRKAWEPSKLTNTKGVIKPYFPNTSPIKTSNKHYNTVDDDDITEDGQNYSKKARKKWPSLIPFGQTPSAKRLQHLSSLKNYRLLPFWKRSYNLYCNPCCYCPCTCGGSCVCGYSCSCQPRLCQPNCGDCDCNYCPLKWC